MTDYDPTEGACPMCDDGYDPEHDQVRDGSVICPDCGYVAV